MIAKVDSNLLKSPVDEEGGNGIGYRLHPCHRHTRAHAYHICLRNAAVHESVGTTFLVFIKKPVADVSGQKNDRRVALGNSSDLICKSVAHFLRLFDAQFHEG